MIRYVVSVPAELTPSEAHYLAQQLQSMADDRQLRDVVLDRGGTITDMRRPSRVPALVRRARAMAR